MPANLSVLGLVAATSHGRDQAKIKHRFTLHLISAYGHRRIRSMTADDLVEWHRKQRATKAAVWTIRARWMAVRGVFGYAARHNIIPASPADKLLPRERPGAGEPRQRFLTRNEMDALLEHAGPALPIIATVLFTGMPVMEVLALVWGDIDFTEGVIHAQTHASGSTRSSEIQKCLALKA
jgi:integrase